MKNRTEFWTAHVAAVKREAISASAYAKQLNIFSLLKAIWFLFGHDTQGLGVEPP